MTRKLHPALPDANVLTGKGRSDAKLSMFNGLTSLAGVEMCLDFLLGSNVFRCVLII